VSFDPREVGSGTFPALVGIDVEEAGDGTALGRLEVRPEHLAPNGYLHAGAVVALADTVCGFGCVASLPEGAAGFTTIELKTNFLGTALDGTLTCRGTMVHGGRTTQVWDATVERADGRTIALFRVTQLLLQR
jgi:1,4-dihydroxy-2-naphthoyl-CoA hydrolase